MTDRELQLKSIRLRKRLLEAIVHAGAGHTGGGLSCLDILNALYRRVLNVSPKNFSDPHRDRYVQSKGHSVEALYVVLAEALPRSEASIATITRAGKKETVSLKNEQATLVLPGDAIKISGGAATVKQFVYVGGDVASPGEREFRDGMTLTQALLSAGGTSRTGKPVVKVARRNASGFLSSSEFNLRSIEDGKSQDPVLEAGDRIEVTRGM